MASESKLKLDQLSGHIYITSLYKACFVFALLSSWRYACFIHTTFPKLSDNPSYFMKQPDETSAPVLTELITTNQPNQLNTSLDSNIESGGECLVLVRMLRLNFAIYCLLLI